MGSFFSEEQETSSFFQEEQQTGSFLQEEQETGLPIENDHVQYHDREYVRAPYIQTACDRAKTQFKVKQHFQALFEFSNITFTCDRVLFSHIFIF